VRALQSLLMIWCLFGAGACANTSETGRSDSSLASQSPAGNPDPYLPTDSAIEHHGLKVRTVKADTLIASDDLEHITNPTIVGKHLWVAYPYRAPFFHVIDTVTGQLLHSLGRAGQGPGEFEHVGSLFLAQPHDSIAWAWDYGLNRFTRVTLNTLLATSRSAIEIVETKEHAAWLSSRLRCRMY